MKIIKTSNKKLIRNTDDAIFHIFNSCHGEILNKLIPVEYNNLLRRYEEIIAAKNKRIDLPGQQLLKL